MVRAFSVGTNDMTLALYLGNILRTTIALHDLINTKIPPVLPITIHLDSFNSVGHLSSSMISFLFYTSICVFFFYRSRSVYLYNWVCEAVCIPLSTEVEESTKKDKKEETKDGKENEDKDKAKGKEKEEKTDDTKDSKGK